MRPDETEQLEGDDIEELFAAFAPRPRPSRTLKGRRERETRPLPNSDRRFGSIKDRQLNLKITQEFYERVYALARSCGLSMPILVERAIEAYARQLEPAE